MVQQTVTAVDGRPQGYTCGYRKQQQQQQHFSKCRKNTANSKSRQPNMHNNSSVTITEPVVFTASAVQNTPVACNGEQWFSKPQQQPGWQWWLISTCGQRNKQQQKQPH